MSESSSFVVVYFEKENSYTILFDASNKLKNCKKANVRNEDGTWVMGEIKFRGSERKCTEYGLRKYNNSDYMPSEDSDFESAEQATKSKKLKDNPNELIQKELAKVMNHKRHTDKFHLALYESEVEEICSYQQNQVGVKSISQATSLSPSQARAQLATETVTQLATETGTQSARETVTQSASKSATPPATQCASKIPDDKFSLNEHTLLNDYSNDDYSNKNLLKMLKILITKVDALTDEVKTLKAKKASEQEKIAIMYKSTNLLEISQSCRNKYVTALMKILFQQEELENGYIIEDAEKSTSKRNQLDPERIKLLKEALFIKYSRQMKNDREDKEDVWKKMKKVGNSVCSAYTKAKKDRENKRNNKESSPSSSQESS